MGIDKKARRPFYLLKLMKTAEDIGVLSGFISICVSHPFDTIKMRLQTVGKVDYGQGEFLYKGATDCFFKILRREGFMVLYKGASLPFISVVPIHTSTCVIYNALVKKNSESGKKITVAEILQVGGISGSLPACIVTPIDRIKSYLQIPTGFKVEIFTPISVVKLIYKTEGLAGFYRGTLLIALKDGIETAVAFLSFYWLKFNYVKKITNKYSGQFKTDPLYGKYAGIAISGGLSGVLATFITVPFDYLKSRRQFNNETLLESIKIMKYEADHRNISRIKVFYKGTPLIISKAFFQYAFMFVGFEIYKELVRRQVALAEKDTPMKDDELRRKINMLEEAEDNIYTLYH